MATGEYIYTSDPGLIIGFHGCDKEIRDKIVSGELQMNASNKPWDWLGEGRYFWQNNYERALDYARHPPRRIKINEPAVLGAVFELGNCLDLLDQAHINWVRYSFDTLKQSFERDRKMLPENTNPENATNPNDKIIRRLDCTVINNIHTVIKEEGSQPFDSVRSVFFEGSPIYNGAGFLDQTHIQICIRNPDLIKGYFIPRKASETF